MTNTSTIRLIYWNDPLDASLSRSSLLLAHTELHLKTKVSHVWMLGLYLLPGRHWWSATKRLTFIGWSCWTKMHCITPFNVISIHTETTWVYCMSLPGEIVITMWVCNGTLWFVQLVIIVLLFSGPLSFYCIPYYVQICSV